VVTDSIYQIKLKENDMLKESRNTNEKARPVMRRRKLQQKMLVAVLALFMFNFVTPTQASVFGQNSFGSGSGGSERCCPCPTCSIRNHNETLVEDDLED